MFQNMKHLWKNVTQERRSPQRSTGPRTHWPPFCAGLPESMGRLFVMGRLFIYTEFRSSKWSSVRIHHASSLLRLAVINNTAPTASSCISLDSCWNQLSINIHFVVPSSFSEEMCCFHGIHVLLGGLHHSQTFQSTDLAPILVFLTCSPYFTLMMIFDRLRLHFASIA